MSWVQKLHGRSPIHRHLVEVPRGEFAVWPLETVVVIDVVCALLVC